MTTWIDPAEIAVPETLRAEVGGHPLVAETLARRGCTDAAAARAFLDPTSYAPASPFDLPDMAEAVTRVARAVAEGERICVWGDFDVDGQTATALLVEALRGLGADVLYHIPNRERESHGVNVPALSRLIDAGARLVLTCDTGVAAHAAIDHAQARGVEVVVTDHHELPPALPDAVAVVNPKRLSAGHPLRELPGVGVAYALAEALYAQAGRAGEASTYLDLAAVGIVADVAVQTGDTRCLLQRGLDALRRTERLGLLAVMELAGIAPLRVTEADIGFQIGPRLNALGRLADANAAVELLTTGDLARARILANELEGLNAQRRLLTDLVYDGALALVERDPALLAHAALVLAHPDWPGGVIGIAANRLVERFRRPVVLITTPPGGAGRGSARSVDGCNITAALAANADLLADFGGHTMAAGLSIDPARIDAFRRALSRTVRAMLGEVTDEPALHIDAYLPLPDLSLDLARDLRRLAPFGPGNPPLVLASRELALSTHRALDRKGEHLAVTVEDADGHAQRVIWWRGDADALPAGRFDLAYTLGVTHYRGEPELQVEWIEARPIEAATELAVSAPPVAVIDLRGAPDPAAALAQLGGEGVEVWAEGAALPAGSRRRNELAPAPGLAIWTTPPGRAEVRTALARVAPARVYLFAVDPEADHLASFLVRLAGLVHRVLSAKGGRADLSPLAGLTAQQERTVRKGLAWLAARGDITILNEEDGALYLARGGRAEPPNVIAALEVQLKALLDETASYRKYFTETDKDVLSAAWFRAQ